MPLYPAVGYYVLHEAGHINSDSGTVNVATSEQTCGLVSGSAAITSGKQSGKETFYWDPAVYPGAQAMRLYGALSTNSTAPTISYTFAVNPLTAPTGAAATTLTFTVGAAVTGSAVTMTTPAANATLAIDSTEFAPPAAGLYCVTWKVNATTIATNACVAVGALKVLYRTA